ncbi:hypothetical protein D3C75_1256290 [compost metagenome]
MKTNYRIRTLRLVEKKRDSIKSEEELRIENARLLRENVELKRDLLESKFNRIPTDFNLSQARSTRTANIALDNVT